MTTTSSNTTEAPIRFDSRFRVLWLVHVRGYRIYSMSEEPRSGPFGRLGYRRHWWLAAPEGQAAPKTPIREKNGAPNSDGPHFWG